MNEGDQVKRELDGEVEGEVSKMHSGSRKFEGRSKHQVQVNHQR